MIHEHEHMPGDVDGEPLGVRLRRAREGMGMTLAEAGERLKVPASVVDAMEREDFSRLGAAVYVRGHLGSYAKLVGVPEAAVHDAIARHAPPTPVLKTTTRASRSRYLMDRYAKRAVYLAITASIVVPVVILATYDRLPMQRAILTALDAPPPADAGAAGTRTVPLREGAPVQDDGAVATENYPVVASLAPFYGHNRSRSTAVEPPALEVEAPVEQPPAIEPPTGVSLTFIGASWVEVIGQDGERLAYGLIPAGEERRFPAGAVTRISLGDADAVEVRVGGERADLSPYRRAKVARFALSSDGELAPVDG